MMAQPHGLYQPVGGYFPQAPQMQYPQQQYGQVPSYAAPPAPIEYDYATSFDAPKTSNSNFGSKIKDHGIPTAKDGRVDTNRAARLRKMMKKVMLKSSSGAASAPVAPPAAPQPVPPQPVPPAQPVATTPAPTPSPQRPQTMHNFAVENHVIPQTVLPPQVYHVESSPPEQINIIATEENELLFLVFISVAGVSLVCILALALYLLKRRRRSAEISMAEDRFDNFKDPGPLSSHSSYIDPGNMSCNQMESKNNQKLNIPAPKDFMDKKDIEMVRTLSRAPAQEELYRMRSNESKDSGFSNSRISSRKVSYIAQLKT